MEGTLRIDPSGSSSMLFCGGIVDAIKGLAR